MKITILLILATFILSANSEMPEWMLKDPDTKGKYFRGTSAWYVTDDARMEALSKADAMHNAYSYVSEFFGVNVASSFEMNEKVKDDEKTLDTNTNIKTKSNQLILNLKPVSIHVELDDSKENFRLHVLILLDKIGENKIQNEMVKDKEEYYLLKEKAIKAIDKKEYFKAKSFLEEAKGKRYAFVDDTIKKIEQRLKTLIDGLLIAKLSINKKTYLPDELIEIEASLNQKGYMYLFYETSSDVEMLFTNERNRIAYVKKEQLISFGEDERVVAYEEDLGKKVQFYAIASKKNLALKGLSVDIVDGIYIFNKHGKYKEIIKRCIDEGECTKSAVDFKISRSVGSEPVELVFNSEIATKASKYFRSKGIVSKKGNKKIVFDVKKHSNYSQQLDMNIETYTINAKLYKKNSLIKTIKDECSSDELNEYLFDMHSELVKI